MTLAISGKSRFAAHRMLVALFVQEICWPRNALLLLGSVQPSTSSTIVCRKNVRQKSTALAVSAESRTTAFTSLSTSRPPYDHRSGYRQPWLSPDRCPNSQPKGCPLALSFVPASSTASQVPGQRCKPIAANQAVL